MKYLAQEITSLEISYWQASHGLVGDTWLCDISYCFQPMAQHDEHAIINLVRDFLAKNINYTFLIAQQMPDLTVYEYTQGIFIKSNDPWPIEIKAPRQAFSLFNCAEITPLAISQILTQRISRFLSSTITEFHIKLRPDQEMASQRFHFCHGLAQAYDNSQRILHGHLAKLIIWHNNVMHLPLTATWCERLNYCYFINSSDVINTINQQTLNLSYQAKQGYFYLKIPTSKVIMLTKPVTIENMAYWLLQELTTILKGKVNLQLFAPRNHGIAL